MILVDLIVGARPNFMKIAPIIEAFNNETINRGKLSYRLVHTGQHYDENMSDSFFEQLGIPEPDINLDVGEGTQASQVASIMLEYENLLTQDPCNACVVVGDVNSTMATAITAQKLNIPVAHVEGGIRSGDWAMPEEINRRVTDSISNWFFTTSTFANQNLKSEGVSSDRIFFVGNTMIDTLLKNLPRIKKPSFWKEKRLNKEEYVLLTLHRPAVVDDPELLEMALSEISRLSEDLPVVFPVHPRTAKNLKDAGVLPSNLVTVVPQPYLEFIYLIRNALAVVTDSGGITEEATVLNVPCLTMRNTTERPETVSLGTNELVGSTPKSLERYIKEIFNGNWKEGSIPEKWDGKASERIVTTLNTLLCE